MTDKLQKRELQYIAVFAVIFINLIWVINVGILVTDDLSDGKPLFLGSHLVNEITGAYSVLFLLPGLLIFFNRFPFQIKKLFKRVIIHACGVLVFGFFHTSLMTLSRKAIYFLMGWQAYDPGIMKFRYLMEFQKQVLIYFFIYGVVALFQYVRANQERRIKTSQLEQQLTKSKLQALKMQLNPHFLFNTLNMISSTMYEDVQKADQMIVSLSDVLRMTLSTGQAQLTTLKDELKILDAYLKIMKARFGDRMEVHFDIEDNSHDALCPALCLQPLFENAVKHSLDKTTQKTVIQLQSRVSNRNLKIWVRDNGPGFEGTVDEAMNRGMGLKTTKERLDTLFGSDHEFELKNIETGGLEICIILPLQFK